MRRSRRHNRRPEWHVPRGFAFGRTAAATGRESALHSMWREPTSEELILRPRRTASTMRCGKTLGVGRSAGADTTDLSKGQARVFCGPLRCARCLEATCALCHVRDAQLGGRGPWKSAFNGWFVSPLSRNKKYKEVRASWIRKNSVWWRRQS